VGVESKPSKHHDSEIFPELEYYSDCEDSTQCLHNLLYTGKTSALYIMVLCFEETWEVYIAMMCDDIINLKF